MSKINYNLSLIKAVVLDIDGVLSPTLCSVDSAGSPVRMINCKDGFALQLAVKKGLKICIISGGSFSGIEQWLKRLGIKEVYNDAAEKGEVLRKWSKKIRLKAEEIAYAGDDIPDLPCLQAVGLPVCPADAAEDVKTAAKYITMASGGNGVARELLEEILRAQGLWLNEAADIAW